MLSAGCIGVGSGAVGFLGFAIAHVIGSRAGISNARLLVVVFPLALVGAASAAAVLALVSMDISAVALAALLAVLSAASLFILYAPALYVVLTSQSVETLVWLRGLGGSASQAALNDRFASRAVVDDRLATLESSGYLFRKGEMHCLTQRGRLVARIFKGLCYLWKLGAGG